MRRQHTPRDTARIEMKPDQNPATIINVLFVCTGNICRSPTAEGVFAHLVKERGLEAHFEVDSAATHAYHIGAPPDPRSQEAALRNGVDISAQRARQVLPRDFETFDYILAMDAEHLAILLRACPPRLRNRVCLMCEFGPDPAVREVPDPYYGGRKGFERVYTIVYEAATGLLDAIEKEHLAGRRP